MRIRPTNVIGKAALAMGVAVIMASGVSSVLAHAEDMTTNSEDSSATTRLSEARTQLVEQKREEQKQKVEAKQAEVKERLSTKRAELCKKRETAINKIVQNSHMRSEMVLTHLQQVEQRVKDFYTKKGLQLDNYDQLVAAMDDAEATASAAVDQLGQTEFSCDSDDATNPGAIAKDAVVAKHTAMDTYRDAIRAFIKAMISTTGEETAQ
jgi:hypothetical protein